MIKRVIYAFTLAEVLITIGIISVVAALTIPNLVNNYQKHVAVTKLKKEYSTINQILQNSYNDNGPVTREIYHSGAYYLQNYWFKYMKSPVLYKRAPYKKINKTDTFSSYKKMVGTNSNIYVNDSVYFGDGFYLFSSLDGTIYYLTSRWNTGVYEVIIDINGLKGPNTLGKDVFVVYQDLEKGRLVDYPVGSVNTYTNSQLIYHCKNNGTYCATKIISDGWQIKKDYPW